MSEETIATTPEKSETKQSELPPAGHIRDVGILDLRYAKTPEELDGIIAITDVGCILVPEHLATRLAQIPMADVGTIVAIPPGENIICQLGQIKLTGEALAAGNPEAILFVIGQAFLTTPVTAIGYKELWIHGQLMALRGSEGALGAKLTRMQGQTLYLPAEARIIIGEETIGSTFLDLLPQPRALVIMGELTFEDDVTAEILKAKVPEIVLMGVIHAPAALVPLVKVLAVEKMGEILVKA